MRTLKMSRISEIVDECFSYSRFHSFIFSGQESVGKLCIAIEFVKKLLHPDRDLDCVCNICSSVWANSSQNFKILYILVSL